MTILLSYYSRTGNTERLAQRIAEELKSRGHTVVVERIEVVKPRSRWNLLVRQVYQYPLVALSVLSCSFRRWWLKHYLQPEDAVRPLAHPDVSDFDHVCIGGPKWCYISYPVARYLKQVEGLQNKQVSAFATFGGPPLEVFELELLFEPLRARIQERGGTLVATLGLSSNYHELFVLGIFKLVTRMVFRRPLESFTIDSDHGKGKVGEFCDTIGELR
jgi:flavorubredoxin